MRPALAQKIVSHGIAEGWWEPGRDVLVDPFAGVGGCLLVAGFNGLASIGCELEPHFVELCERNIALHDPIWGRDGNVRPVVVQGDSRELGRHVAAAMGSLCSPPYGDRVADPRQPQIGRGEKFVGLNEGDGGTYGSTPGNLGNLPMGSLSSPPYASAIGSRDSAIDWEKANAARAEGPLRHPKTAPLKMAYGGTPGQLGEMPAGSVSSPPYEGSLQDPGGSRTPNAPDGFTLGRSTPGVGGSVGSPPYAGMDPAQSSSGIDLHKQWETYRSQGGGMDYEAFEAQQRRHADGYGASPGQLGAMPKGCVSSPPFEDSASTGVLSDEMREDLRRKGHKPSASGEAADYGDTAGQLGNEKGTTFWDALRVIAGELHALLPGGGDPVPDPDGIDFCDCDPDRSAPL